MHMLSMAAISTAPADTSFMVFICSLYSPLQYLSHSTSMAVFMVSVTHTIATATLSAAHCMAARCRVIPSAVTAMVAIRWSHALG